MSSYNYSSTPASNTSLDGVGVAGSDTPQNADNAFRELASNLHDDFVNVWGGITAGGSADALTITLSGATVSTAFNGMAVGFIAASDNTTTSPTAAVSSIGAEPIKKALTSDGAETALAVGDIQAGGLYLLVWRSTWDSSNGAWQLINLQHDADDTDPQYTTIELGHASDTTLSRASAGVMAVEGKHVPSPASQAQGDILYHNGTTWARLGAGTSGQYLQTQGAGSNPQWAGADSGFAKFWAFVTVSGGTPTLAANHNVTSITDTDAGRLTITIATDFSSANWCCVATVDETTAVGSEGASHVRVHTKAAGSVLVESVESDQDAALTDPEAWNVVGFGAQ